jgi:hypothetical protein
MIRAILHETYGCRSGWIGSLVQFVAVIVILVPLAAYLLSLLLGIAGPSVPFGQFLHQLIWGPRQFGAGQAGLQFTLFLPIVLVMTEPRALPSPQSLYSISREKSAQLAFIVSLLQVGAQLLIGSCTLCAIGWCGARLAGAPSQTFVTPGFIVEIIALAPLIPGMLWVGLYSRIGSKQMQLPGMIVWIGAFSLAAMFSSNITWRNTLLSPVGLTTAALILAANLYFYRAALLHLYRHGDLLQRKISR